jgi:hypothetical protein
MLSDIRIGYLIGFKYQGIWTVGEVLSIDNEALTFTVKINDSPRSITIPQSEAKPPF